MNIRRKYIIALDSFKGCLTSAEAGQAAAEGVRVADAGAQVEVVTVSDGGEGMLDAFAGAVSGRKVKVPVRDPLMRRIEAEYIVSGKKAIIEAARTCGLALLKKDELNPLVATSYGLGEMLADAIKQGCCEFIIGLGGTATSDAGMGMLRALVDKLAPQGCIDDVLKGEAGECRFTLASDVTNPLLGDNGAAHVFAPQKGADSDMVQQIEIRTAKFAEMSARHFDRDMSLAPGAGAAGGLGYAFMQYFGAECRSGAKLLFGEIGFGSMLSDTFCVITGEGRADRQTLMGKLPSMVREQAEEHNVPVWLVAGQVEDEAALLQAGFGMVRAVSPVTMPLEESMRPDVASRNISDTVCSMVGSYLSRVGTK